MNSRSAEELDVFIDEAEELVDIVEQSVLGLNNPESRDLQLSKALRALHTLKGNAGLLGLNELSRVCHDGEGVLASQKNTPIDLKILTTMILEKIDQIRELIEKASV